MMSPISAISSNLFNFIFSCKKSFFKCNFLSVGLQLTCDVKTTSKLSDSRVPNSVGVAGNDVTVTSSQ